MFQSSLDEVLDEVDDLDQEPGEDEIREYAELIGIDPDNEPELLWIARAGITAPLPADWKPIQVNNGDELYFYNIKTGESSWEHPSDDKYRQLVFEERNKKSQQKPKNAAGLPAAKAPAKPPISLASTSAAAAATAALKPLKQPGPAPSPVGKLAPIGGTQMGSVGGPPGKLQPISAALHSTPATAKPSGKTLAPIGSAGNELERPKTSRGPAEKGMMADAPAQQWSAVLGGGSRFLKKNDDQVPDAAPSKDSGQQNILQNVLRFPTEESDSDSGSSLHSDSISLPGAEKERVVLDLHELKAAADSAPVVSAKAASKPPIAPKLTTPAASTSSEGKSQLKAEPSKPPVATSAMSKAPALEKPNVQSVPPAAITNETPRKSLSDTSDSVEKVERQLQEEYERRVKQLREQHDAKLKDVRLKFEEEEKKETEKIKRAMEDRLRSHKEKLRKDEENETKSLTAAHKKQMDELQSKLEKERVETEKQFRLKTQADLEETQKETGQRREKKSDDGAAVGEEKMRLEAEQKKALDALKRKFDQELADEERRHETEKKRRMDDLRDRLQKELDEWYRKEKERKTAVLKNDIDKEAAEARKNMEAERRALIEAEVTKDFERRRRDMVEQHESQLMELRREHEEELNRTRRKTKELVNGEIVGQQRQSERVRGESFDDLRQRQDDALKTAELQLKSFRDELSALTRMTVDIRHTLRPTIAENNENIHSMSTAGAADGGARKGSKKSEKTRVDKAAVVKSIDDLISPDANGDRSSGTASSLEQKLDGLESEDMLDKVTRFLESQKATGAHMQHRTSSLQRRRSARREDFIGAADAVPVGTTRSVNGSLVNLQSSLNAVAGRLSAESQRRENVFRIQSKDAVDEILDRKVKEYFHAHNAVSSIRDRPLWMPSGVSHYQNRYFTNRRRAFDVESELNSLKRWLSEFETRVSDKAMTTKVRSPALHSGGRNGALPIEGGAAERSNVMNGMTFLNEEEVVEI